MFLFTCIFIFQDLYNSDYIEIFLSGARFSFLAFYKIYISRKKIKYSTILIKPSSFHYEFVVCYNTIPIIITKFLILILKN
jgi:hypothetical protein